MRKIAFIGSFILFSVATVLGQSSYEDFTYPHRAVKERKPIPHRFIREANVKYSKRIHRVIDTREKQNIMMNWPRNPFYRIVWESALKGEVTAYKSDSLTSFYTPEDVEKLGGTQISTTIQDPKFPDDPYMLIDTTIYMPFEPESIKKYRIMEDWIFDYNYSDFRARIIAIAPLFRPITETGLELNEQPLFWIKWNDFRPVLANQEIFNTFNDASRLSFDQFFETRRFSSYIVKESNVWDSDIKYLEEFRDDGIAALLESDRIKNDLFIFEHDLWEY